MTTVTREHKAGLELFKSIHKNDIDYLIGEELDRLIAQASAAPEQEAVAEVTDLGGGLYYGVKLLNGPKECLNPLIKPGDKLYTHPSAEIEQLRESLEFRGSLFAKVEAERNELRKKLADAQALLREVEPATLGDFRACWKRMGELLSTTAQPAEVKS